MWPTYMRTAMKYTITTAHWRIPSEARAFDGWLEGSPTADQRAEKRLEVSRLRENWKPNREAWEPAPAFGDLHWSASLHPVLGPDHVAAP